MNPEIEKKHRDKCEAFLGRPLTVREEYVFIQGAKWGMEEFENNLNRALTEAKEQFEEQ